MTSTQTFNIDGEHIAMSLAWRCSLRRLYRAQRGRGRRGPLGTVVAREAVDRQLAELRHDGLERLRGDLERV